VRHFYKVERLIDLERTEAHRLPRVVLNERRRRAVKLRLSGTAIAETVAQCELGRSAVIRAKRGYERGGWKAVAVPVVGRPLGSGRQLTAVCIELYSRDYVIELQYITSRCI
jgi:transposase